MDFASIFEIGEGIEITDPRGVQSYNLLPKDAVPDK
jgi:hypothetical protein